MRIYIKTPLFNNSKAVPHMVEHCTGHTLSLADFFEHSYGIDGIISAEYTMFEYDDRVSYSDVMEKLLHPLQKKAFLYEKKVLQEEIGNTSYSQGIYEYLVKKIIHPTIALNTAKSLHRDDVLSYHQKRYQPEQMLVVNDDYEILYQGLKVGSQKRGSSAFFSFPCTFKKDKYIVLGAKDCSSDTYWELHFLFQMMRFYYVYQTRGKQKKYVHHLSPYFQTFEHHTWITIPKVSFTPWNAELFAYGKKYLVQMMSHGYFKEKFFLNQYFYGIPASRQRIIENYQTFSRTDFSTYLKKYFLQ